MKTCNTTCPYCGVGCGVTAQREEGGLIRVVGDDSHPANAGRLCVKGTSLAETLVREGRLLHPMSAGRQTTWDHALDLVAQRMRSVREEFGPQAIAFYLSGQLLTEDYYVANKLMKGFMGSANVDTNSRLCMSSAVAGYKRAFGEDLVPCDYLDLEICDLLLIVGSNAAWTHPVVYQRIVAAKQKNPHKRVVVIDPRRTSTCDIADLHLQLASGSDAYLFAGLLHYLCVKDLIKHAYVDAHTQGFTQACEAVADLDISKVADKTGLPEQQIETLYSWFAATEKTVTLYSQGINQSATGTDKCNAIINCHLATAGLGRPGCGPFSITGQPNAMGGREVGGLANQLAAHMDFAEEDIDTVERFWQATDMAREPGLKAVEMFQAAAEGKIRFLWIMATNPAVSLPDTVQVRAALEKCDFVVVSDCSADTDTAAYADLLLPAAGWGEKEGTVTNSERCISRQRALQQPIAEARADWWIIKQVASRLGYADNFAYTSPADIFREHAALSAFENSGKRAFDIGALAALSAQEYASLPPTYWPAPVDGISGRLLADGEFYTASGRAQFMPVIPAMPVHSGTSDRGLSLNTGRLRDQWHTMTRTGLVPRLMRHQDFYSVAVNAREAVRLGANAGDVIELRGNAARVRALLLIDDGLPMGQVFSPIHWSDQFSGDACISALLPSVTDPVSGQPQSKFASVQLYALSTSLWGICFSRDKFLLPDTLYWSRVVVEGGYLTLMASANGELAPEVLSCLGATEQRCVEYTDENREDYRYISQRDGELRFALFINRERDALPLRNWLGSLGTQSLAVESSRLLAGMDASAVDSGRVVCSCWEVGENQIIQAVEKGACSVQDLGDVLRCGTQCGSCVPELKQLIQARQSEQAA